MKNSLSWSIPAVLILVASSLGAPSVEAAPKAKPTTKSSPQPARRANAATGSVDGKETGVLTGSHLRSTYLVRGHTTDAAQPVYIIDRRDPRFASRSSVGDVSYRLPFASSRGR